MKAYRIKDLQEGTYFTRKPYEKPKENQVWVRETYDRSERKYWCSRWSDVNDGRYFKGDTLVYIDGTF